MLHELGFAPPANANVHAFVRHYLYNSGNSDALDAADLLHDLQRERNRADYDLRDPKIGSRNYAMLTVERAHGVVSAIDSCRPDDVRESIRAAIGEYEQKTRTRP